ncbi:MAG: GtrA family protein [Patescibacteria group bacterium]
MKKDFYLVTLIGFLVGCLFLLPVKNIGFTITPVFIFGSVLGFTLLAPIALFILKRLSRFWPILDQFGKFAATGTLNTLLDLGVLNLLILLTDISQGIYFSSFKAVSFLAATTNSYFWNKFWTFQSSLPTSFAEYLRFGGFTLLGALVNVSVASFIVSVIGAPSGIEPKLWANVGAVIAVLVSFILNFLSYKLIVFKAKQ